MAGSMPDEWRHVAGVTTVVMLGVFASLAPSAEPPGDRGTPRCTEARAAMPAPGIRAWWGEPKVGDLPRSRTWKRAPWPASLHW